MTAFSKHMIDNTLPEVHVLVLQLYIDKWKPLAGIHDTLIGLRPEPPAAPTGNDVWDRMLARAKFRETFLSLCHQADYETKHTCAAYMVKLYIERMHNMEKYGRYTDDRLTSYDLLVEQILLTSYLPKVNTLPPLTKLRAHIGWLEHCQGVLALIEQ